jgi:flagellar M-ring protein FliF
VHLVASSVPNLEAQQVSVVDQQGKLLSKQGMR